MTSNLSIAVVDDDPSVCRALSRLLRSCGLQVRTFDSAQAFLGSLQHPGTPWNPDCALVDVQMPGMTGLALQQVLQAHGRRCPLILMTAHDSEPVRSAAQDLGATAYLLKPIAESNLLRAIATAADAAGRSGPGTPAPAQ